MSDRQRFAVETPTEDQDLLVHKIMKSSKDKNLTKEIKCQPV